MANPYADRYKSSTDYSGVVKAGRKNRARDESSLIDDPARKQDDFWSDVLRMVGTGAQAAAPVLGGLAGAGLGVMGGAAAGIPTAGIASIPLAISGGATGATVGLGLGAAAGQGANALASAGADQLDRKWIEADAREQAKLAELDRAEAEKRSQQMMLMSLLGGMR